MDETNNATTATTATLNKALAEQEKAMTTHRRDTFEYSGDSEWAVWRRGVLCGVCWPDSGWKKEAEVEAIGLAVEVVTRGDDSSIEVTPVCETCAEGKTVHRFPIKEDN